MTTEKTSPEEFRSFIRELGIRAFDQLAIRFANVAQGAAAQSEKISRQAGSLARLANYWSGMPAAEKQQFFEQMISAAQSVAAAAPAMAGSRRKRAAAVERSGESVELQSARMTKKGKKKQKAELKKKKKK